MPQVFFDQLGMQLLDTFYENLHPIIVEHHEDQLVLVVSGVRHRDLAGLPPCTTGLP